METQNKLRFNSVLFGGGRPRAPGCVVAVDGPSIWRSHVPAADDALSLPSDSVASAVGHVLLFSVSSRSQQRYRPQSNAPAGVRTHRRDRRRRRRGFPWAGFRSVPLYRSLPRSRTPLSPMEMRRAEGNGIGVGKQQQQQRRRRRRWSTEPSVTCNAIVDRRSVRCPTEFDVDAAISPRRRMTSFPRWRPTPRAPWRSIRYNTHWFFLRFTTVTVTNLLSVKAFLGARLRGLCIKLLNNILDCFTFVSHRWCFILLFRWCMLYNRIGDFYARRIYVIARPFCRKMAGWMSITGRYCV